jgi:hypothetical protein
VNNKSVLMRGEVPEYTVLRIECNETYLLEGCKIVVCLNGSWIPNIGHCSSKFVQLTLPNKFKLHF